MIRRVFLTILVGWLFLLTGCSNKDTRSLLDFEKFQYVNIQSIAEINVEWDINENSPVVFEITDENTINSIINALCREEAFTKKNVANDSGHSRIILVDDSGVEITVSLAYVTDGNDTYYYSDDMVYILVYNAGIDQGALTK